MTVTVSEQTAEKQLDQSLHDLTHAVGLAVNFVAQVQRQKHCQNVDYEK